MTTFQSVQPVQLDVTVNCSPAQAFDLFTTRMAAWWPASHHIGDGDLADVRIEPRAGGRWYETTSTGAECDWGHVITWEPPERLVLAWSLNPEWAYDPSLVTEVEIRFTGIESGHTNVTVEHRDLDRFGERSLEMQTVLGADGGWPTLLRSFSDAAASTGWTGPE